MADNERRRSRDEDDEPRSSRRETSRDRDEDRGSRSRDRDDEPRGRSRDRDEDERPRRGRDSEDDEGGGRRSSSSGYSYERRSSDQVKERQQKQQNGDFDRLVKDHVKVWKPNDGDNRIRVVPPTWKKPEHFGYDLYVHYGVGADRQSYLCLHKHKDEKDPIHEAYETARRELNDMSEGDSGYKDLKEYVKSLKAKPRTGIFLVDRDHEKEGVQFWAMPQGMDGDIVAVMQDKKTGEVLNIDDPEEGYDVEFVKTGKGINTEYKGVAIARRSSPLGNDKWLQYAIDNPLPDQLVFFDYDHIAKAFGGKGAQRTERTRDSDDDRGSSRSRDEDDRGSRGRDRDDDRGSSRGRARDDDERPARGRAKEDDEPTYESVHEMTRSELEDLIEQRDLDVKPKQAKNDEDLADWVCEEMKLKKAKKVERNRDDGDSEDKLASMRRRREERD
jgi:hypothetical protein